MGGRSLRPASRLCATLPRHKHAQAESSLKRAFTYAAHQVRGVDERERRRRRRRARQPPRDRRAFLETTQTNTHQTKQGPVRCLDAAGAFLVSGGNDDQLHIYDVKVCVGRCVSLLFESAGANHSSLRSTQQLNQKKKKKTL